MCQGANVHGAGAGAGSAGRKARWGEEARSGRGLSLANAAFHWRSNGISIRNAAIRRHVNGINTCIGYRLVSFSSSLASCLSALQIEAAGAVQNFPIGAF